MKNLDMNERLKMKRASVVTTTPKNRLPIAAVSKLKKWYDKHIRVDDDYQA